MKIENIEKLVEVVRSWNPSFQKEEIEAFYKEALAKAKEKHPSNSEKKLVDLALSNTFVQYDLKRKGAQFHQMAKFILLSASPLQLNVRKKFIDGLNAEFNADNNAFLVKYGRKFLVENGAIQQQTKDGKYFKLIPYDQVLAFGLLKKTDGFKPIVIDFRNQFAQDVSRVANSKPFQLFDVEISASPRNDASNNEIYSGFNMVNPMHVPLKEIWDYSSKLPEEILASVDELDRVAIRSKQVSAFNVLKGFVAVNCTITRITTNQSGSCTAQLYESPINTDSKIIQATIPKELGITNKFGDETQVIAFGKVLPNKNDEELPNLWVWSMVESYDASLVTAPIAKVTEDMMVNEEANSILSKSDEDLLV